MDWAQDHDYGIRRKALKTLGATFVQAQQSVSDLEKAIKDLTEFRDEAALEIAKYLRVDKNIELDPDAIHATLTRPYTLLPINEHESWLIHWRGVKMPIFGWVVAQEPAFIKAKVTRSMDLLTPLPVWMKQELGWKPPAHSAIIDGTRTSISLTEGDEAAFRRRYGSHLGARTAPYIDRVLRYCWSAGLSSQEMAEGLGVTDPATKSRLNSACKGLVKVGLMVVDGKRFRVNQDEIGRLRALSGLRQK
jgi:hypothetical protein